MSPAGQGGRKRDDSRDDAIRQAALKILAEAGYDRLTIDAVAARAGAGKATVYRRWAGKADLIIDAVVSMATNPEQPDTGSLRSDLIALTPIAEEGDHSFQADLQIGLVSGLVRDAKRRQVFTEQLIAPRTAVFRAVLNRAVERGEIAPNPNVDMLADVIPAMLFHQLVMTGHPPNAEFALALIDQVFLPLITTSAPRPGCASSHGTHLGAQPLVFRQNPA
ncbi:TetR/AcrR family transcriptional regulator [Streptomyces vinaceus]